MHIRRLTDLNRGLAAAMLATVAGCTMPAQWPQWGGPDRNFMSKASGLADSWPENGPEKLWHRELGDGYSTVVVDRGVLYTMYRTDEDEFTVALDAKTGETIWEHKNSSPITAQMAQYGPGPHSTPLVVGKRLFTVGTHAVMHCFDKRSGKVLWKHDLAEEFSFPVPGYGYASSPIAYNGTVIVPVDRERPEEEGDDSSEEEGEDSSEDAVAKADSEEKGAEQTLVAFDQKTGEVAWKKHDFPINYSSPILIDFEGEEQLAFLAQRELIGVNPANGELLWQHVLDPPGSNIATPVWNGEDLLFLSSAYDSGSRVIKLTKEGGKTVPERLWYSRKLRIHHGNAIRIGEHVYGSSGDFGTALLVGMNIRTGKVVWRERGFAKTTIVHGDGKIIFLDEDGQLALATVTPEGLTVHSKCKITERLSWAAPTLVGKTLYVRDRKHIMALDLG